MNRDKLIELAKKAGIGTETHISPRQGGASTEHIWGGEMQTKIMNNFAELVVADCLAICEELHHKWNFGEESGPRECSDKIKEHFGIQQ